MNSARGAPGAGHNRLAGEVPAISVRSLKKIYQTRKGPIPALESISFDIPHGQFVSVVGPSGCGKSTILKILAGIVPQSAGSIALDGDRLTGPSDKVGVVFQSPVLLPWRTVYENVLLPIDVRREPRAQADPRARALLDLVGLRGFEDRYPFELSGGMQQRVSICRSLITDPAILLMDEPFGALDAMTREHMNLELQRIWMEKRKTVLLITHSIPEAVFLSDRVIVMTSRPGTIDEIISIDLPRPRELDITSEEQFGFYAKRIRAKFGTKASYD